MNTLSLRCLQGKLMSFGIFCTQALFDYSEKEHKGLLPQAAQISQKQICLKIRNDWRVQGSGRDDGKIYPTTYWKRSWLWAYKQQRQGKGACLIRHESRQRAGRGGHKPDSWESGHSFPSPAPEPPLCLSFGMGGESAAHGAPQRWMLPQHLVQWALLEVASAPKCYFCTVSHHCSSCLSLRLLFLLAVCWTSSSCGHLCLGCLGLNKLQPNTADETSQTTVHHQELTSAGTFLTSHCCTGFTGQDWDSGEATGLAHIGKKTPKTQPPKKPPQKQKSITKPEKNKYNKSDSSLPQNFFCG